MLTHEDLDSEAERLVWARVESGELVDCRVGDPEEDHPANGAGWGEERRVRAELLIQLVSSERRASDPQPRALRLRRARISGELNLQALMLACPLALYDCYFEAQVTASSTSACFCP